MRSFTQASINDSRVRQHLPTLSAGNSPAAARRSNVFSGRFTSCAACANVIRGSHCGVEVMLIFLSCPTACSGWKLGLESSDNLFHHQPVNMAVNHFCAPALPYFGECPEQFKHGLLFQGLSFVLRPRLTFGGRATFQFLWPLIFGDLSPC